MSVEELFFLIILDEVCGPIPFLNVNGISLHAPLLFRMVPNPSMSPVHEWVQIWFGLGFINIFGFVWRPAETRLVPRHKIFVTVNYSNSCLHKMVSYIFNL